MSANYIQLYDDNVVKFSIRQGEENDRWAISGNYRISASDNENTYIIYNTDNTNNTSIIKNTNEMVGSFTIGELVCTRDTNRVFLGNFSDILKNIPQQQTLGGVLSGNKYLGYVDSKPLISSSDNGTPETLSASSTSLLNTGSRYRSYHHTENNSTTCKLTEDKKWCKQTYYNEKYDAYDGDYMYDIYRNALIIFDHNIKPSKSTYNTSTKTQEINTDEPVNAKSSNNNRRRTPLIPYAKSKEIGDETVYNHTSDMYGDGYVLIYNVIPDGKTLTFEKRDYDKSTGKPTSTVYKDNYSQNIIKINELPIELISEKLNSDHFVINGNKINIHPSIIESGGAGLSFNDTALQNIWNDKVKSNTVLISDDNGFILKDSGIKSENLTGLTGNVQTQINTVKASISTSISNAVSSLVTQDEFDGLDDRVQVLEKLHEGDINKDDDDAGDEGDEPKHVPFVNLYFDSTLIDNTEDCETASVDGVYSGLKSNVIMQSSKVTVENNKIHNAFGYNGEQTSYKFIPNKNGTIIISARSVDTGFNCYIGLCSETDSTIYYKHLALIDPVDAKNGDAGGSTTCLPVKEGLIYAFVPFAKTLESPHSIIFI